MKEIHRLIVTSDTYKLASEVDPKAARSSAELAADPEGRCAALALPPPPPRGRADLGRGLRRRRRPRSHARRRRRSTSAGVAGGNRGPSRRGAYMIRGYSTNRDVVPNFLQAFDVDDGRAPCPIRTRTVTAPRPSSS